MKRFEAPSLTHPHIEADEDGRRCPVPEPLTEGAEPDGLPAGAEPVSLCFSLGSITRGIRGLSLEQRDGQRTVEVYEVPGLAPELTRGLSETEWPRLCDGLFRKLRIQDWEQEYTHSETRVLDGNSWSLEWKSADGREHRSGSLSEAYPETWREFLGLLAPFFAEYEKSRSEFEKNIKE